MGGGGAASAAWLASSLVSESVRPRLEPCGADAGADAEAGPGPPGNDDACEEEGDAEEEGEKEVAAPLAAADEEDVEVEEWTVWRGRRPPLIAGTGVGPPAGTAGFRRDALEAVTMLSLLMPLLTVSLMLPPADHAEGASSSSAPPSVSPSSSSEISMTESAPLLLTPPPALAAAVAAAPSTSGEGGGAAAAAADTPASLA